jgi:hypothetical protein
MPMPSINVSDKNIVFVDELRQRMPFINNKLPDRKKTIELILQFIGERELEFIQWAEEKKVQGVQRGQKRQKR